MCALDPEVVRSTAIPGMKWSTVLVVGSIGTRTGAVHVLPSVDVLYTMSFSAQPLRNRQSYQATYTLPAPSTSADGSPPPLRRPPPGLWMLTEAMANGPLKDAPPFVDRNASMPAPPPIGMITVPSGCTTGCPPMTDALGTDERLQFWPPSVDRLILRRSPCAASSHST